MRSRYPATHVQLDCPSGVKEKIGAAFSCTATLDGERVTLGGKVTSAGGGYSIQPEEAIVVSTQAAATLQQRIAAQLRENVSVSCGLPAIRIVPAGGEFTCDATLPGQSTRQVIVSVLDSSGNMRFSLTTG